MLDWMSLGGKSHEIPTAPPAQNVLLLYNYTRSSLKDRMLERYLQCQIQRRWATDQALLFDILVMRIASNTNM